MTPPKAARRERFAKYQEILGKFGTEHKTNREAVKYLESLGFTSGQARSAAYQYRKQKGLVKPRLGAKRT